MIYKPEAVVDLDTGATVSAQVLPGDQADNQQSVTRFGGAANDQKNVQGIKIGRAHV